MKPLTKKQIINIFVFLASLQLALVPFFAQNPAPEDFTLLVWMQLMGILANAVINFLQPSPRPRKKWTEAERVKQRLRTRVSDMKHRGNK